MVQEFPTVSLDFTYIYIYMCVCVCPIWDPCGLEYRPHMGYTCRIHIGNENGFWMGPIWDLSGIRYGTHVFLRYITHVSHVDPIWIPHECQMFPRWLSCKSWFNPRFFGCIQCISVMHTWCRYMFLKINSTVSLSRDCTSLHKFMSVSLHGIHLRPHFTSFIYGYKLIKGYLFF